MDTLKSEEALMARWDARREPLVSVICLAYNHAEFIRETLDGFIQQETDFPSR